MPCAQAVVADRELTVMGVGGVRPVAGSGSVGLGTLQRVLCLAPGARAGRGPARCAPLNAAVHGLLCRPAHAVRAACPQRLLAPSASVCCCRSRAQRPLLISWGVAALVRPCSLRSALVLPAPCRHAGRPRAAQRAGARCRARWAGRSRPRQRRPPPRPCTSPWTSASWRCSPAWQRSRVADARMRRTLTRGSAPGSHDMPERTLCTRAMQIIAFCEAMCGMRQWAQAARAARRRSAW